VVSVSDAEQSAVLDLKTGGFLLLPEEIKSGDTVFVNNLLAGSTQEVLFSSLSAFQVTLPAFGSAVYTVSMTRDTLAILNPILDVREVADVPLQVVLYQNYPNPFNPSTTVEYELPAASHVTLTVHDILGREVVQLFEGVRPAGVFRTVWDARSAAGAPVATGTYFCRLSVDDGTTRSVLTRIMVLLR
jgi:hypothetical protein